MGNNLTLMRGYRSLRKVFALCLIALMLQLAAIPLWFLGGYTASGGGLAAPEFLSLPGLCREAGAGVLSTLAVVFCAVAAVSLAAMLLLNGYRVALFRVLAVLLQVLAAGVGLFLVFAVSKAGERIPPDASLTLNVWAWLYFAALLLAIVLELTAGGTIRGQTYAEDWKAWRKDVRAARGEDAPQRPAAPAAPQPQEDADPSVRRCPNCGTKCPATTRICWKCGTTIQ